MLRNSGDTNLQQFLGTISIDSNPKSCSKKLKDKFKKPCGEASDDLKNLWNMRKQSSCKTYSCLPMKTCKAKIAFHANGEELVNNETHGLNLTPNLNVGGNQIGYVYQEKNIVDTDQFLNALRDNNPLSSNVVSKIAEQNHNLFNIPYHSIDGTNTGNPITNACPKRPKPCPPRSKCKKPDPMLYNLGIGSDGFESRDSLRDIIEAGRAVKASQNINGGVKLGGITELEREKSGQPPPIPMGGQDELQQKMEYENLGVSPNQVEQAVGLFSSKSRMRRSEDEEPQPAPPPQDEGEGSGEATPLQQTLTQIQDMPQAELGIFLLEQVGATPNIYQTTGQNEADEIRKQVETLVFGRSLKAEIRQSFKKSGTGGVHRDKLQAFYNSGGTRTIGRKVLQALDRIRPPHAGGVKPPRK